MHRPSINALLSTAALYLAVCALPAKAEDSTVIPLGQWIQQGEPETKAQLRSGRWSVTFGRGARQLSLEVPNEALPRVKALVAAFRSHATTESTLAPLLEGDLPPALRRSALEELRRAKRIDRRLVMRWACSAGADELLSFGLEQAGSRRVAEALPCLLERLRGGDAAVPQIIDALGDYGPEHRGAIAPALRGLTAATSRHEVRLGAILALGRLRDVESVDTLRKASLEDDIAVASTAVTALGLLGPEAAPALEIVAEKHSHEYMRDLARRRKDALK